MITCKLKQYLLLLIGITVASMANSAEKDTLFYHHKIEWTNEPVAYPQLPFNGSGYWEDSTGLLIYHLEIPLPPEFNEEDYHLDISKRQWVPFEGSLSDLTKADLERPIAQRITHIQKQSFIEVDIVPFDIYDPKEETWQKLTQLTLAISYTPKGYVTGQKLKSSSLKYRTTSRLATGKWVKIATSEAGIHKIPYSTLTSWGFSDPSRVQIYGQGGKMVPMANEAERPDDLPEIALWHHSDALYFFSSGIHHWEWNASKMSYEVLSHKYSPLAYYFLSEVTGATTEVQSTPEIPGEATQTFTSFDYLYLHESELENLLNSGNQWFGEKFSTTLGLEKNFTVEVPLLIPDSSVTLTTQVFGRANTAQSFLVTANGTNSSTIALGIVSLSDYTGYYGHLGSNNLSFIPNSQNLDISFTYTNQQTTSAGWLDYFLISGKGRLALDGSQLIFSNHNTVGPGNLSAFSIETTKTNLELWDITNPEEPQRYTTSRNGNRVEFKDSTSIQKSYVLFDPTQPLPEPEKVGTINNQNLHGTPATEMVIVAPASFLAQANRLANLHASHSGLSCVVADRDQLYNEFSWGHPDPGAIRSFLKMLYDRAEGATSSAPQLLLLFGDGSYDNRHISSSLPAPLPTYQSDNSIYQTSTFVSDDFYGFLDDDEGDDLPNDRLDIGIGRLPVNSEKQAISAVDKSEAYLTQQSGGNWKTRLTFVGDDGDYNIHMRDAELLTNQIDRNQPFFDINKIYLDAYKATSATTGKEFPGARSAIERAISEGTLFFNYTGHGSENNLAHEQIITRSDINGWTNLNKLPLFVTATCEFSRFDNHELTSAGEEVFLNPNGGAIALLSTTRIVYSSLNFTLNKAFCNHVFEADNENLPLRLGEIMRRTKLESGSSINKLSFTLLGDPALRLNYPANKVITQSVNGHPAQESDTLKALSVNTLKGILTYPDGQTMETFNGELNLVVYDKAIETETLGNDGAEPFEYTEYSNILFKGVSTVTNGQFSANFVIPQDIRYNFGPGRILYYAISDEGQEASGAFSEIIIGGIANTSQQDQQGPELQLYLNHPDFNSGDQTGNRPMLYAKVYDESGINTSGIGIGHDITLIIDGDTQNPLVLNEAFSFNPNSYQEGMIVYHLSELSDGNHELTLKVWDTHNNSSTASISFVASSERGLKVRAFTVYPNPVTQSGEVYATLRSDEPNSIFDTTIDFIDIRGRVTGSDTQKLISTGNLIGPFRLPLESSGWHKPELCFVRLTLTSMDGRKAVVVEKLLPAP